jgi:lipoprotein-anchoring transpeptidase ErfK/SrfK
MIPKLGLLVGLGLLLGGCVTAMQQPVSETSFKPRDREYLANAPYRKVTLPYEYQRAIVDYHRKEAPGSIVVDSNSRHLYYVLNNNKAIRYGVAVGEEAQSWSGVAKVGAKSEWPGWTPTPGEHKRLGPLPSHVPGGPANPMGARALYLYANGKDTLFRIHGTNQPEWIGHAISSGCIRMTNEDVIDLYNRTKMGTTVVVLPPSGGSFPQMAFRN